MNKDRSGHNVRVNTAVHPSRDRSNLSNSENSSLEPRRNGFKSVPPPIRAGSSELQRESAKSQSPAGGLEPPRSNTPKTSSKKSFVGAVRCYGCSTQKIKCRLRW